MNQIQQYNFSQAQDTLPFWITNYGGNKSRVTLLQLSNVAHPEDSCFHPTRTYIDASIAPLIQKLNDKGYITTNCCSGLDEDHEGQQGVGYIAFEVECPLFIESARIDGNVFRAPLGINNQEKKEFWAAAYAQTLRLDAAPTLFAQNNYD